MPTRLLLEGADIEALLTQIRDEHGSAARIVSADKVRRGGVGGFFARQRFEIAVEVDDGGAAGGAAGDPDRPGRDAPAPSFTSLVDRADAAELRLRSTAPPVPPPTFVEPPPVGPGTGDREPAAAPTEAVAFTELLDALRSGSLDDAAGRPARPARSVLPSAYRAIAAPTDPAGQPGSDPDGVEPTAVPTGRPALAAGRAAPGALEPVDPRGAPAVASPAGLLPADPRAQRLRGLAADLVDLGVPAEYAWRAIDPDRFTAALQATSALPVPPMPPAEPGDLLVLLGDPGPAVELAARLAEAVQGDAGRIMVAAPTAAGAGVPAARRILGPDDAARRGRRLHIEDVPHVVVVAAPVDGGSGDWVRAVTRALRPTAVWALVDCTRKTGDLARHLATLGPLDALALHGTPASADPATVLQLGLPVAYLYGRPATAGGWAGLLCALLAGRSADADPAGQRA